MADNQDILFGASFSGDAFAKGTETVLSSLKKVQEQNALLIEQNELAKASINKLSLANRELEKDYKNAAGEINKMEKEMVKLGNTTTKTFAEEDALIKKTKDLKKAISEVAAERKGMLGIMAENDKQIGQFSTRLKAGEAAFKSNTEQIKNLNKEASAIAPAAEKASGGFTKMYSGLRTLANIIPGIGIGGLVGLFVELATKGVSSIFDFTEALSEFQKEQATSADIQTKANESFSSGFARIELFRAKLTDLSIPEKERLKLLKEYNKTADEQDKIDVKQINNLNAINSALDRQIDLLKQRALAQGSQEVIADRAKKLFEAQLKVGDELRAGIDAANRQFEGFTVKEANTGKNRFDTSTKTSDLRVGMTVSLWNPKTQKFENKVLSEADLQQFRKEGEDFHKEMTAIDQKNRLNRAIETDKRVQDANEELERALRLGAQFTDIEGLLTPDKKVKDRSGREIENVFLQKLRELQARLAAAAASEFQSDTLIKGKFAAQLDKEFQDISQLLKDKKLTGPQADILKGLISQINGVELSKGLDEFHRKQKEASDRVSEEITAASLDDASKRIANIRDEFEREGKTIEQGYQATITGLKTKLGEQLKALQEDVRKGSINPVQGQQQSFILTMLFGDLMTQAGIDKANRQLELAFRQFQKTLADMRTVLDENNLHVSDTATKQIQENAELYVRGGQSFEKYQKNLTKILRDEQAARRILQLSELRDELKRVNDLADKTTDPTLKEKLETQRRDLEKSINALEREMNGQDATNKNDINKKRFEAISSYAHAIEGLLSQIASFWQQVNAVEAAALDRSIALQEKRVDRAKDIAEKGNAEYLEMEQKRLDELERKREANAQRQLAINQALTLSQALVAVISAIAQATATGSPIAAIAAVGAVIGAIGAGYAFVKSLQPTSNQFYEGSEYVEGHGRPRGKDTVPARLNIGERVITTDTNDQYWDSLHAIHNHLIPADIMNKFVNEYPSINFQRLDGATNIKIGADSAEVTGRLDRLNERMGDVVEAVGRIGVHLNLDADGLAVGINNFLKNERLRRRT